ncbi:hypothetical protein NQ318_001526 [Aromia moschata]|uniref:DUF5641 domain-containing protein n=1 Tax=Aromia moschata TaxID=1265417 RepID=A0AAV8X5J6_9CUCU|nr:hypothetical protein NQ318_001526 [Aromia moschata]
MEESRTYPLASEVILRGMHIDDLVTSISDLNTARYLDHQLVDLFESCGFNLVKWCVNSKELLDYIPKEKLVPEVVNFETDCLKVLVNIQNCECTKRNILSTISRIFDPLGLVAPVTLYAKLLVKKLWSLHLNWDECPPPSLLEQWSHFQLELPLIDNFSVPRHIGYFRNSTSMALGFADACESSYCCSIPRLKLCAAVLLAKLFKFLLDALGARIHIEEIYAFSDSMVVLHWIHASLHRWKTFVANRVSKIHNCLPSNVWLHVEGKDNPADGLSRGMIPSVSMKNRNSWLMGLSWLTLDREKWPIRQRVYFRNDITALERGKSCSHQFLFKPKPSNPLMANLSSARVVSQVKPFIETGSDFAGPYHITLSRNHGVKMQKAYICLFICLTTKCLHLELASDLSTLTRRGPIKVLHSDCATNYVGAKAQLDEFYTFIASSEYTTALKDELLKNRIEWRFNTPSAPHMGGIWESNIRSVKKHLHKVLGVERDLHKVLGVKCYQVYPGSDGIIRTALVKIKSGCYKRPVIKLCPLPKQ